MPASRRARRRRSSVCLSFFFQAEDGIRDDLVTGVQTCALPISSRRSLHARGQVRRSVAFRFRHWESRVKRTSALRAGLASLRRKFAPSLISRALKEVFSGRGSSPVRAPRPRQAQAFLLEALEPRLLLSAAPIDYTLATTTNLTLSAVDATHVQLSGGSYTSASTDLSASSGALDIFRGSLAADLAADTIHLDLNSLQQLTTGLSVNFTGGLQSLLFQDHVQLDGAGTFGFDVKVQSDSAIKVSAGASLAAGTHDITLQASEKNSVLGVSGHNFAADATHATVTVLGDLSGANVSLEADSTIDTTTSSLDV